MIQYLPHKDINFTLWDACILQSHNPLLYGVSWYLNEVCDNKWDALILGNYEAVMPLCYNRKWGLKYIYPPLFAQQLGVFSKQKISSYEIDDFLNHIPTKFRYVEMCVPLTNASEVIVESCVQNTNIVLSLNSSYTDLFQNYSTNLKRNLKKVNTAKLVFAKEVNLTDVIELFKNFKGLEYPDMGSKQYETLLKLNEAAIQHKQSWCVGVRDSASNELLAGALFMVVKQRIIFLFSGVSAKGKQERAMFYLIDQMIQLHADKDIVLDFEGSNNTELARFYLGFGSREEKYGKIKINRLPLALKWLKS